MGYAIRPAVNPDCQNNIRCLLKRPAGGILLESIQETSGRVDLIVLLAVEPQKRLDGKWRPSTKGPCAIAALAPYQLTPLVETPRTSRRQ